MTKLEAEFEIPITEFFRLGDRTTGSICTRPEQAKVLGELLLRFNWNKEIVVEIGTYRGWTAAFIAKVFHLMKKAVPVLSIDPFEETGRECSKYMETINKNQVKDLCTVLVARSEDVVSIVPSNIGVLVIDGEHNSPTVDKDIDLYLPKVVSGGFVFIDDYDSTHPDVVRAADEHFSNTKDFVVLDKVYGEGTGCLIAQRISGA